MSLNSRAKLENKTRDTELTYNYVTLQYCQDLDHDGIAEAGGKLQVNREQISEMLPARERDKRQKEARQVSYLLLLLLPRYSGV